MKRLHELENHYGGQGQDNLNPLINFANGLLNELKVYKTIAFDLNNRFVATHSSVDLIVPELNDMYREHILIHPEDIERFLDFSNAALRDMGYLKELRYLGGRFIVERIHRAPAPALAQAPHAQAQAPPAQAQAQGQAPPDPVQANAQAAIAAIAQAADGVIQRYRQRIDELENAPAPVPVPAPALVVLGSETRVRNAFRATMLEVVSTTEMDVGARLSLDTVERETLALFHRRYADIDLAPGLAGGLLAGIVQLLNTIFLAEGVEYVLDSMDILKMRGGR